MEIVSDFIFGGSKICYSFICVQFFWDTVDCSLQGSSVHRILQARILEWVAIPFSKNIPGDVPDSGVEPGSPVLQADSLPTELQGKPVASVIPLKLLFLKRGCQWSTYTQLFCFFFSGV